MIERIIAFRKELHTFPELSGQETETAQRIKSFIESYHNTRMIENIGGNGLAVVYSFSGLGPTVLIRCELDALPIQEANQMEYRSIIKGISHKCGHDGHMAIVAGLIFWIKRRKFNNGRIVLLFQPAEENGVGAHAVLSDPKFQEIIPDYVFALHNMPGIPLHNIVIVRNNFSASVQSLAIHLTGKESHASEPENGVNPALAISKIINEFTHLNVIDSGSKNFALLTPIFISLGKKAYGISAGKGEIHFTVRTWNEGEMNKLEEKINRIIRKVCDNQNIAYNIEWFDCFPATKNDSYCIEIINSAAIKNRLNIQQKETPFKFGEDFGWFSQKYNSAMFAIGAGENSPALHHAEYDFPDEIIRTGMEMFKSILDQLLS